MIRIYGIPNCDVTKKTLDWCRKNNIPFQFHDYKKEGINRATLQNWTREKGWETLLNKRGTTWRKLEPSVQESIRDAATAIRLMVEETSLIKRPVIETGTSVIVGFDEANISSLIKQKK